MLGQYTFNLKSRILDCFDFLQKSRNDKVGGIVIAICCAFCVVIARALPEAIHKIKSFCFVWLLPKVESLYPIDSNLQGKIPPIHSWLIYFTHCFKTRDLDTSLHCVSLSMTNYPHSVILSLCKRRSIHFGDLRILRDSLTLGESMCLRFTRFTLFGLLRRIYDSPRNDKSRQSTFHTTFKGIKMQT